ncbi:hypothetical protein [Rhodococcus globerulus]|uniref:hypothetical protein n=1 Tax=Rhodococcus globerulus TaxID=33008 RepID=UPI001F48EA9C|nr:hypothetical protein [Rhodococcus globerulus]MCE4268210.1 hypothetical protein [Rhodococcus globerulus]
MNEPKIETFMRELCAQGRAMSLSLEQYSEAREAFVSHTQAPGLSNDRCFLAAQSILTCAALVSKVLWTSSRAKDAGNERDRAELRMALGITSLPALKSRRVRNSIEHFDDRLDNFFSNAEGSSTIAERIIGPIDTITVGDIPVRYLRHLDLDDDTFTVLEDSVSLGDLTEAVDEVARKAEAWLQSNMPGMQTVRWL